MAELKKLCQKRTTIKGQMTRINNTISEVTSASEAKIKAKKIEELWKMFEEADGEEEVNVELQQESEREREVFENVYFEAATKSQTIIDMEKAQKQAVAQVQIAAAQGGEQPRDRGRFDVKLPTLNLPEFKGDYNEWLLFKDAYVSMIHANANITAIQKFQYLRNSLKGEALQVISGLKTSAENYESAWELLERNYENTKLLINTHLNSLLEFPAVAKDKPATIRQLIVHIRTHLKALKTLKISVEHWDELLIHMTKGKLNYATQKDWEEECNRDRQRRKTLEEYLTFLNEHCCTLEMINKGKAKSEAVKPLVLKKQGNSVSFSASVFQQSCLSCSENHAVYKCPQFLQMSVSSRIEESRSKKACLNCLEKGHFAEDKPAEQKSSEESSKKAVVAHCVKSEERANEMTEASVVNFMRKQNTQIVLSTVRVNIEDANGKQHSCHVLLDPGSQSNLITEELVSKLKLKCRKRNELISGVNQIQTTVGRTVTVKIKSMHTDYGRMIECLVLPHITEKLPQVRINTKFIVLPEEVKLADPSFHEPGTIDFLIGAGVFWELLCADSMKQAKGLPKLQSTLLGWIVGGELIDTAERSSPRFCGLVTNKTLQMQLECFWTQEEIRETRHWTKEEAECERHFCETFKRDTDGRFIVALPHKQEVILGESETQAKRRFFALERRLKVNPEIKSQYVEFMKDYEQQGHMSLVPSDAQSKPKETYVLPHHPVIRPESITTKLRVVFDASAETSLGTSLNDRLMVGSNLQEDLFSILMRFRTHEFAMTADIAAMYHQILVQEEDSDFQRIF
ncbi:uncharacterized protein LOC112464328 [Temnothorax curvispinosus]|uniref:Uncharacterized protein LOC112464328 n=1 Tax=Temnothorax curvispinosus TaxID=300111 RepID=A0A6J1R2L4_9HYME|nr:uncharacterized protein LOC112464328 [Temnothorax curvispinosus]